MFGCWLRLKIQGVAQLVGQSFLDVLDHVFTIEKLHGKDQGRSNEKVRYEDNYSGSHSK